MSREFLKENRDELFTEVPNLITADFQEDPDRIVLTVLKPLEKLPEKEYNGKKVVFEQLVLGGVIHEPQSPEENMSHGVIEDPSPTDLMFGKECIGPHNVSSKNTEAVEAWKKRNSAVKVK
jgi:hypothetical protein